MLFLYCLAEPAQPRSPSLLPKGSICVVSPEKKGEGPLPLPKSLSRFLQPEGEMTAAGLPLLLRKNQPEEAPLIIFP